MEFHGCVLTVNSPSVNSPYVALEVLLPGAPLFLAHVAEGYEVTIHEAREVSHKCG